MRQPDALTYSRVAQSLAAVPSVLVHEITITWLAHTLGLAAGGPMLDAPRLGPAWLPIGTAKAGDAPCQHLACSRRSAPMRWPAKTRSTLGSFYPDGNLPD